MFTTCFRMYMEGLQRIGHGMLTETERDSAKDQAVVWIFILATVGLLSYAGVRPWIDQWAEVCRIWDISFGLVCLGGKTVDADMSIESAPATQLHSSLCAAGPVVDDA